MFFGSCCLVGYITISLLVVYPLIQSTPDYLCLDAYVELNRRWGNYELILFNLGIQSIFAGLFVAMSFLYSNTLIKIMLPIGFTVYG